ncbi:MAG: TonB family protein, partial [Myxococcota bacterium]
MKRHPSFPFLALALLAGAPSLAFAQDPPPPPEGAESADGEGAEGEPTDEGPVPPAVADFVEAPWPEAVEPGEEPVAVLLEIVVAVDGSVSEAQVLEGPEAFHAGALEAVRAFRFTPARVGGEAVEARIRFQYVFEPPPPPPEPEPPAAGRLEGRVLAPDGDEAIAGTRILLSGITDPSVEAETTVDEDGAFAFEELPPGDYLLNLEALGYESSEATETVAAGEATELIYRLRPEREGRGEDFGLSARARVDPPPREVTRRVIRQEELTQIPGTRGDALRAIEILPGVGRPPFGSGQVIIRGSAPNDSEIFFEGIPVPLLYHFGGLTSIYNSRLLTQIDFVPGNFSSRYGRRTGGIIEVETRDPATDGLHGVVEFGVIDTSILAEFPVGENASMAFGFRRSLIDIFFNAIVPDDLFSVTQVPVYYDWQSILTWRPTPKDRLRFQLYGASDTFALNIDDGIGEDPAVSGNLGLTTRFANFQIGWDRQIDDDTELDMEVAYGPQGFDFGLGDSLDFDLF